MGAHGQPSQQALPTGNDGSVARAGEAMIATSFRAPHAQRSASESSARLPTSRSADMGMPPQAMRGLGNTSPSRGNIPGIQHPDHQAMYSLMGRLGGDGLEVSTQVGRLFAATADSCAGCGSHAVSSGHRPAGDADPVRCSQPDFDQYLTGFDDCCLPDAVFQQMAQHSTDLIPCPAGQGGGGGGGGIYASTHPPQRPVPLALQARAPY